MDSDKELEMEPLFGKTNWKVFKYRVCICLNSLKDSTDNVGETAVEAPPPPLSRVQAVNVFNNEANSETSPNKDVTPPRQVKRLGVDGPDLADNESLGSDWGQIDIPDSCLQTAQLPDEQLDVDSISRILNSRTPPREHNTGKRCTRADPVCNRTRVYHCPQCEYKINSKGLLKMHADAVHNQMRFFQCAYCKYKSIEKFTLRIHIESIHNKKKGFQCPNCDYKTNWRTTLKRHVEAIHKETRPYQCSHCKYKSGRLSTLRRHIVGVHIKIRVFPCPLCENKFGSKRTLKKHVDYKHKKLKPFQCPHCEYKTDRNASLQIHISSRHKDISGSVTPPGKSLNRQRGQAKRVSRT